MVAAAHFAHLPLVTPATVTVTVRHADEAAVLAVTVVLGVGREAGPFRRRRLGRLPDTCTHTNRRRRRRPSERERHRPVNYQI